MRVTLGGADAGMTEKNLDDPKIGAILQKPCRIAVPESVRFEIPFETGSFTGVSKSGQQGLFANRAFPMDRWEKPDRITVSLPEGAHGFQERFRKRNEAFLIAFADDSKDHAAGIDGFDFQFSGFAGA
jgi:hypothetical protein